MTMAFRTIKANLVTLLGTQAAGRYRVLGFQEMGKTVEVVNNTDRLVEVYYKSGDFPKSGGSMFATTKHGMTFRIDMSVSRAASVDLTVLNNPASTPVQIAAALTAFDSAKELVDDSFDELFDIIYNILMDPRNQEFGGVKYSVGSRWINGVDKDEISPRGEYAILTGTMRITCSAPEELTGEVGTAGDEVDLELELNAPGTADDGSEADTGKAGIFLDP